MKTENIERMLVACRSTRFPSQPCVEQATAELAALRSENERMRETVSAEVWKLKEIILYAQLSAGHTAQLLAIIQRLSAIGTCGHNQKVAALRAEPVPQDEALLESEAKAEIEALKRESEIAKTQLDAWQSIFGTTQLSHAQARLEVVEKGLERAQAEVEAMRSENKRLRKELETCHAANDDLVKRHIRCYEAINRKLAIAVECLEALKEAKLFAAMDCLKRMEEVK